MTDAEKLAAIEAAIDDRVWIGTDVIQNILVGAKPYNPTEGTIRCR